MKSSLTSVTILSGALSLFALVGCGRQQQPAAPAADSHSHAGAQDEHGGEHDAHAGGDHHHDATDIETEMAKLSAEDRALAEMQKICPVSNDLLGSMGTPIKVTVDGKDVFVCCQGCVDPVKSNIQKYIDKLKEQKDQK